jgi:thioredoxin reductase (NADPH)
MKTKFFSVFIVFLLLFVSSCSLFAPQDTYDLKKVSWDQDTIPLLIIGGGCAGLTAGIYAGQANIPCLIIQGPKVGGALAQSHSVRNFPGFNELPGADIVNKIKEQARIAGAEINTGTVTNINLSVWPRTVEIQQSHDGSKRTLKALSIIIALGTEPNKLGVSGEDGYWTKGVSNCATCDGPLFADKKVAVVGGGDAAIEEANYLSAIASTVYILIRDSKLKAKDKRAVTNVLNKKNVTVLYDTKISNILGDGTRVTNLELFNTKKNEKQLMVIDGLFLAIGSKPNTSLLRSQLECNPQGFIICKNRQETSVPGVFAAGDVSDPAFVQAVTAAGDGCKAALQAIDFLKRIGFDPATIAETQQKKKETPLTILKEPQKEAIETITTAQSFKEKVIDSLKPVYLDVVSPLCTSCQQMMTVLESMVPEYKNSITFIKINITEPSFDVPAALAKLGGRPIQSAPTGLVIVNGKEVARFVGVYKAQDIKTTLDRILKK